MAAEMPVTGELLVDVLELPEGTEIVGAGYDARSKCVVLSVTSPSIGFGAEKVNPVFTRSGDGKVFVSSWGEEY